jgi:sugar phosphate isomerase/epimerase
MLLGYNTNGFANHPLDQALLILAELGYKSVALTLDYHALNPFDARLPRRIREVQRLLQQCRLRSVVETGARFLLDPWRKHRPTLVDPPRQSRPRVFALERAIDIARALGADAVSFWSGTTDPGTGEGVQWKRLIPACRRLADYAAERGVRLAFEPEPGMFIDGMARFAHLHERVGHPAFGLTLDIGHLHCQGELPIADHLHRWRHVLWNIHIEDMRRGIHDHLMFGDGEIDFGPVMDTLQAIAYAGGVHVELSRHSHDAVETARRALAFLSRMVKRTT